MSIVCNSIYLTSSSGELNKFNEIRLNRDQVIELFMNKPDLLSFLAEKVFTYNRLLAMEYYKYIQLLAIPIGKIIQLYPLIYDYYGVDLSDTTFYPTIFTGAERVVEYIDWLKKSKAEYLRDFKKWLINMKTSIRVKTITNQVIYVFNDSTPELITYLDSINIAKELKITILVVKKYQYNNIDLINITYYPWS